MIRWRTGSASPAYGLPGAAAPGVRVDAQDRAVRDHGRCPPVAAAAWERSAPPQPDGVRAALRAEVAGVDGVVARGVAGADVQVAVGAEDHRADGVAAVLLAPAAEQHRLLARPGAGGRIEGEPAELGGDAAVVRSAADRARVGVGGRVAVLGHGPVRLRVLGVQRPQVGPRRVLRVEHHAEESAVAVVVDPQPQVRRLPAGGVVQVVVHLDDAAPLGDEDLAGGGELHAGRLGESGERHRLDAEPGRRGVRRGRDDKHADREQRGHRGRDRASNDRVTTRSSHPLGPSATTARSRPGVRVQQTAP